MTFLRDLAWTVGAPARLALLALLGVYRLVLSAHFGGQCRFYPSCSHYAEDAIRAHGAVKGSLMATWRVMRCGPFTRGGVDHVPPPRRERRVLLYDSVIQRLRGSEA